MQVQSVDNQNSNVKFKSKTQLEQVSAFVNMDDAQLMRYACEDGFDKKKERNHQKAIINSLYAIPLVDTLASGVTVVKSSFIDKDVASACRKAPLSFRTAVMARTGIFWTAGIATVGLYGLAKKAVTNNSEKAQKFERKNPLTSFMLDIGILTTGFFMGQNLLSNALNKHIIKTYEKNPKAFISQTIETDKKLGKVIDWLDNTSLNKNVITKFAKWGESLSQKAPLVSKTARFAVVNSIWILLGLGIAKSMDHAKKESNRVERNYLELKNKQLEAAKYLNATIGVERDVLAKDNRQLASDLRNTLSGKKVVDLEQKQAKTPETSVEQKHKTKHKHDDNAKTEKTKIIIIENEVPVQDTKKANKADSDKTKAE